MKTFKQLICVYALVFGSAIYGANSSCYAWGGRIFNGRGVCSTCNWGKCCGGQCATRAAASVDDETTTLVYPKDDVVAPCEAVEACDAVEACGTCDACANNRPVANAVKTVVNALTSRLNAVRAARGCRALQRDAQLEAEALEQCKAMASYGGLFHRGGAAEICAYNYGSGIDGALNQWTGSGAHFQILFGGYTRVGVATYRDAYGRNWCCARFR